MSVPLISRKAWGARYRDGFYDRPMPFREFWLHHSATIAPDLVPPFTDDDAAVRLLETIGQQRFGGGISYNQPVTPVGRCYVGVSPDRVGAHTKGHNTAGFAFVLVGNHTSKPPTAAQEEVIAKRMVELHRAGKATRHTLNGGHRDASGNSTSCPGDGAHARIPHINARANELWRLGYPAKDSIVSTLDSDDIKNIGKELLRVLTKETAFRVHSTVDALGNPVDGTPRTGTLEYAIWCAIRDSRQGRDLGLLLAGGQETFAEVVKDALAEYPGGNDPDAIAASILRAIGARGEEPLP